MKRVCFVIQRYGNEVNGGAELQSKLFAEHLNSESYKVEVATTKAIDYMTWKDEYTEDVETINGIVVHRFGVDYPRDIDIFNEINGQYLQGRMSPSREQEWFDKQGPVCTGLIEFIKKNKDTYDAFVFFGYLYYPAVMGLPLVKEKAIFVPEAHDEPYIKMNKMKELFTSPKAFFFNTDEERELVHELFNNDDIPSDIGGIGIDEPSEVNGQGFKEKYKLDNYILYVGRIDEGKNCNELFNYFRDYKLRNQSDIKLVLIGKNVIPIPECEDIIPLGFVSDQDKTDAMAAAKVLVLPSKFESLSMVVLEAMALKTPVIVNGGCEVLKGHCKKSNGAFYYNNYFEWEGELNYILSHNSEMEVICENARRYVDENYRWNVVIKKLQRLIDEVSQ